MDNIAIRTETKRKKRLFFYCINALTNYLCRCKIPITKTAIKLQLYRKVNPNTLIKVIVIMASKVLVPFFRSSFYSSSTLCTITYRHYYSSKFHNLQETYKKKLCMKKKGKYLKFSSDTWSPLIFFSYFSIYKNFIANIIETCLRIYKI